MKSNHIILMLFLCTALLYAQSGKIAGVIVDASTDEPLAGANVVLEGTAIGAASDINGEFVILNVPIGSYNMIATYIGYKEKTIAINLKEDETLTRIIPLEYDIYEGETITVTAQAEGQMKAINQQLSSNTITNVVSSERIQELPDANAAESVGRLPGISIKRSGGEGNKVVVRGLQPKYNTITIDGVQIPATDLDDRSVDISMVSPEMLSGIEVTKALTPDMDANAIGGNINFDLAKAPAGGFKSIIRYWQGYNGQRNDVSPYKFTATLSDRFLDEKFGIMITGSLERVLRGSDQFSAGYEVLHDRREDENWWDYMQAVDVSLDYIDEVRDRMGVSLLMDYKIPGGRISLNNFVSRLDRNEQIRTDRYSTGSNVHSRRYRERERNLEIFSNALTGEHDLGLGSLDWRLSRSSAQTRHPYDSRIRFREKTAFDSNLLVNARFPEDIISAAYNNGAASFGYEGAFWTEQSDETDHSALFNLSIPYTISTYLAGNLKLGGKYLHKGRDRDVNHSKVRLDVSQSDAFEYHHSRYGDPDFVYQWSQSGNALIGNYLDPSFHIDKFLDGRYDNLNIFDLALSRSELNRFVDSYLLDSLYRVSTLADLDDFETTEEIAAAYVMTELNLGDWLMILPGVRYEYTDAHMVGRRGTVLVDNDDPEYGNPIISDTTASNSYENWFPMAHLRFRPVDWFDIRLAFTRSLSRPQLNWMLPKEKIDKVEFIASFGAPYLKPQVSTNYDIFLSFYANKIGLLTIGGFYKEVDDLIFQRYGHLILNPEKEGYPDNLRGMTLDKPENSPFRANLKGVEIEWQTNLHWLPAPLNGLVLNLNYSHIWSEAKFPRSFVKFETIPVPPFRIPTVIDTFRVGNMPDQADDIANISVGYDKGPFSIRVSFLYQGKTLFLVGERPEYDQFTSDLARWDLAAKYKLSRNIEFFVNLNNITNRPDETFQFASGMPTTSEFYGMTGNLGVGLVFP